MNDEDMLFTSASTVAYGISATDGDTIWKKENGRSVYMTKPLLSSADKTVYFVEVRA